MSSVSTILIFAALLGLVPAFIARHKGYPFFWWWVIGALVFIIALPASLLIKDHRVTAESLPPASPDNPA